MFNDRTKKDSNQRKRDESPISYKVTKSKSKNNVSRTKKKQMFNSLNYTNSDAESEEIEIEVVIDYDSDGFHDQLTPELFIKDRHIGKFTKPKSRKKGKETKKAPTNLPTERLTCNSCRKSINKKKGPLSCISCKDWFHKDCIERITNTFNVLTSQSNFRCPPCNRKPFAPGPSSLRIPQASTVSDYEGSDVEIDIDIEASANTPDICPVCDFHCTCGPSISQISTKTQRKQSIYDLQKAPSPIRKRSITLLQFDTNSNLKQRVGGKSMALYNKFTKPKTSGETFSSNDFQGSFHFKKNLSEFGNSALEIVNDLNAESLIHSMSKLNCNSARVSSVSSPIYQQDDDSIGLSNTGKNCLRNSDVTFMTNGNSVVTHKEIIPNSHEHFFSTDACSSPIDRQSNNMINEDESKPSKEYSEGSNHSQISDSESELDKSAYIDDSAVSSFTSHQSLELSDMENGFYEDTAKISLNQPLRRVSTESIAFHNQRSKCASILKRVVSGEIDWDSQIEEEPEEFGTNCRPGSSLSHQETSYSNYSESERNENRIEPFLAPDHPWYNHKAVYLSELLEEPPTAIGSFSLFKDVTAPSCSHSEIDDDCPSIEYNNGEVKYFYPPVFKGNYPLDEKLISDPHKADLNLDCKVCCNEFNSPTLLPSSNFVSLASIANLPEEFESLSNEDFCAPTTILARPTTGWSLLDEGLLYDSLLEKLKNVPRSDTDVEIPLEDIRVILSSINVEDTLGFDNKSIPMESLVNMDKVSSSPVLTATHKSKANPLESRCEEALAQWDRQPVTDFRKYFIESQAANNANECSLVQESSNLRSTTLHSRNIKRFDLSPQNFENTLTKGFEALSLGTNKLNLSPSLFLPKFECSPILSLAHESISTQKIPPLGGLSSPIVTTHFDSKDTPFTDLSHPKSSYKPISLSPTSASSLSDSLNCQVRQPTTPSNNRQVPNEYNDIASSDTNESQDTSHDPLIMLSSLPAVFNMLGRPINFPSNPMAGSLTRFPQPFFLNFETNFHPINYLTKVKKGKSKLITGVVNKRQNQKLKKSTLKSKLKNISPKNHDRKVRRQRMSNILNQF